MKQSKQSATCATSALAVVIKNMSRSKNTNGLGQCSRTILDQILAWLREITPHCTILLQDDICNEIHTNDICLFRDGKSIICAGKRKIAFGYRNTYFSECMNEYSVDGAKGTIINQPKKEIIYTDKESKEIWHCCLSNDEKYVLACSHDKNFYMWDKETCQCIRTFTGHVGYVQTICISTDGLHVVSGSKDGTFKIWNIETAQVIGTIDKYKNYIEYVKKIAMSNKYIITCFIGKANGDGIYNNDTSILVWCAKSFKYIHTIGGPRRYSKMETFCMFDGGDKSVLYTNDKSIIGIWNAIYMWNLDTIKSNEPLKLFKGHTRNVTSLAVSPDGLYLFSGSCDNTIRIWNTTTGRPTHVIDVNACVEKLEVSRSGHDTTVATLSCCGKLNVWKPFH